MDKSDTEPVLPEVYEQYRAYLLRVWQERPHGSWRGSLQDATTGERHMFASVAQLAAFLQTVASERNAPEDRDLAP